MRNAAEASPGNKKERCVEVVVASERDQTGRDWAGVEIKDTGEGIPASIYSASSFPLYHQATATEWASPSLIALLLSMADAKRGESGRGGAVLT